MDNDDIELPALDERDLELALRQRLRAVAEAMDDAIEAIEERSRRMTAGERAYEDTQARRGGAGL